jgi:hypothetical protein
VEDHYAAINGCSSPVPNLAQDGACHEQGPPARVYVIIRDGTCNRFAFIDAIEQDISRPAAISGKRLSAKFASVTVRNPGLAYAGNPG